MKFQSLIQCLLVAAASLASTGVQAYEPVRPGDYNKLNVQTGSEILYEVQVRAANACRDDWGADWQKDRCRKKVGTMSGYYAHNGNPQFCGAWNELKKIKLGTLDDLLDDSTDYHAGITLKYIKEKVGATTVWLMPLFPNNDRWNIPDEGMGDCDNLGSPYAVRDYMHASGRIDAYCVQAGVDEYSAEEKGTKVCWGNGGLDKVISKAHSLGLKVMLDVALNHFGHNYLFYDYTDHYPVRERIATGQNLDQLWNHDATYDGALVHPELLDTEEKLRASARSNGSVSSALQAIEAKCPGQFSGDRLVRVVGMWREMLDWERARFKCENAAYLEYSVPGFYLGTKDQGEPQPSWGIGSNYTNNWKDVKFLFHHEYHSDRRDGRGDFYQTFVRNREYLFRVMNYWVSRGVDGFRMDHTTDFDSGMGPNEWKYIISKVNYYDWQRKGKPANHQPPIYMAEEFGDQGGMNHVVDAMTEGYVFDIRGMNGQTKNASYVEDVLNREARFAIPGVSYERAFVLRALETHDEPRVFERTGFDQWTAAGFWGVGAASRGLPMLLMGQEFGERDGLGFRRSTLLPGRFYGHPNHNDQGEALIDFYRKMNGARQSHDNRALRANSRAYLRSKRNDGKADERIFAQVKWDDVDGKNVMFTFNNLWPTDAETEYFISPELGDKLAIQDGLRYRLVNVLSGQQAGSCKTGAELKWGLYVHMAASERVQWLRLEICP